MQMHVQFQAFESIHRPEDILRLRDEVGKQLQKIMESGKFKAGGIFADGREGVMILDVVSSEELFDLLGPAFLDHATIKSHPLMDFQKLGEFFAKEKAKKTGK